MFMGEATRLSDWFGSFWVKQSDGSRKVIHCAGNEFTQVSVRSRVVQDGGASGGDIQLLTTRKATTYQHLSTPASVGGNTVSGGAEVTTLGKELHVLPSITWSPLPPRRATAAAAQSLCVTLYCDDTLDDFKDITSRMVTATTTTTATATSKTVGGDLAAVTRAIAAAAAASNTSSKVEVTTISTTATSRTPANLSREGHNYHVAFQNPIAATMSNATLTPAASVFSSCLVNPYVPLNATPSLGKRNINVDDEVSSSDALGMNLYPPLDTPSPPSLLAQTQMRPSMMNYMSPLDNTHSPMHISHTPYSPLLGAQRASLQPPPLSSCPSTASTFPQYSNRPKFNTLGSSSKRHPKPTPNRNTVDGVNIASLCTPATVTDASLTAHLPPWHSIGNISLSYQQLSSSNDLNQNKRATNDDCGAANELRHRSKSRTCPCFPHPCERVHPSCRDTAARQQHHVITNQNDVLRVESTHCYPVVHSSPTPSTAVPHPTANMTRSPVPVNKSLVLPLKDSQQPLPPYTLHSAMAAMNGTTTGLKKNLSFASPPDNKQSRVFPLTGPNATPVTTTASATAVTPISPSDSLLSTGFYVSPSSSVPQKPCTHPRDTPTHQPSSIYSPSRKVRTQSDPSAHDLRLDSIHDLTWLNAMEPEDQVMLEVHVIWSLLTLMVVLLACYSVHHNPLSG